ncbi:SPI-1 type III secretion system effector SipA [Salmonella enterica]|uniref:Pathogenicity island 1 effector protein SipA n=1 Tax=Salmonella enterica subsp. enterica serovar Macclesfield str. S-1643 TaxID=1242107 RepID=A0A2C9NW12_SALET|nr:SPI-1 type III secretion system effector SipA [Salmonella enterica]ASG15412.1 pathogenicity island 1 effector protein SipA [Salmonella enterica subsp. enterica serovar Macclesfield str. S-1643]EAA5486153.1 type III secretion system effector SipA [Salmonella enterica subsp. enterica serovar Kouka]EBS1107356.1 type III secretion system effector SipA [Salmonella enterica subsp. enterica serovar Eingedi]
MVTSVRTQPPVMMPGMQTEIKTQATNLAANLSAVRESATATLSGEIKGPQLEDFPALIKQASLDALFKCGKDAEALKEVFTNSNNVAGKKAIMEFAGLFRSALNATSDSPAAKTLLMKVGAEYTAEIIKDGLKEKSAFGPWMPETKKAEAKLEKLEKQLLDIIKNNTGGELSKLSTNLVMQEVMPYIASCIEHNFGCMLDPLTRSSLTQLVDKAAAKAVEALDMCHQKLTQEQGTSVGREARHLETQTLIPLLLRNVFAQIPADKLPDPKIPEPAAGPVPDGGKKAEPTGINININIDSSNHSVDNSKHINNSRSHVDNSQRHTDSSVHDNSVHDNSRKTIDNSRTMIDNSQHHTSTSSTVTHSHSRMESNTHHAETTHRASTGALEHGVAGKFDVTAHAKAEVTTNTSAESTDGKVITSDKENTTKTVAFDEVDGGGNKTTIGKPVQATVHRVDDHKVQSQKAEVVNLKPLAGQQVGVNSEKVQLQQSETTVVTGNKANTIDNGNNQSDKAGPFSGLKFKQNSFLSTVPSVTYMHSIHFNAREAFLGVIRKALEPDTSTPFPVRRAFDGLRAEILPNDTIKSAALKAQCSDIDKHPELKAKMETLKEVITHHPQKEKLAAIALQFAREAGLTRQKGETDFVLSNVLDGLIGDGSWRAGPAYESYLNKPGVDRVFTTVDGLHMQL